MQYFIIDCCDKNWQLLDPFLYNSQLFIQYLQSARILLFSRHFQILARMIQKTNPLLLWRVLDLKIPGSRILNVWFEAYYILHLSLCSCWCWNFYSSNTMVWFALNLLIFFSKLEQKMDAGYFFLVFYHQLLFHHLNSVKTSEGFFTP